MEMTNVAKELIRKLNILDFLRYSVDRRFTRLAYRWFSSYYSTKQNMIKSAFFMTLNLLLFFACMKYILGYYSDQG